MGHDELANLHEAMSEASQETAHESSHWSSVTFRLPEPIKERTMDICEQNGTDISKWLRRCCMVLGREYLPVERNEN